MGIADETKEYQLLQEDEDEQVSELERKTGSFRHGSTGGSTITTNTSSSSSFSGDTTEELPDFRDGNDSIVYFNGEQGSESAGGEIKQSEFGDFSERADAIDLVVREEEIEIGDVKDYDVENVLANQETHDLVCPECKACITKRVILTRRKRRIPALEEKEDSKRPRVPDDSNSSDIQSEDHVMQSPGGGQDLVPKSFLFKCLSCFTLFEGNKPLPSSERVENLNTQPEQEVRATGDFSWFSPIFGFTKKGKAVEKGEAKASDQEANPQPDSIRLPGEVAHGDAATSFPGFLVHVASNNWKRELVDGGVMVGSPSPTPPVSSLPFTGEFITDIPPVSSVGEGTVREPLLTPVVERPKLEILKSIVYGGLIESITSLGVISSAAGSGATTLNIVGLGLANLFSGLIVIMQNLQELRKEEHGRTTTEDNQTNGQEIESPYNRVLGRKENFKIHASVAILSFIIFGLVPPVVYYFSYIKTHNTDYQIASVFGSSLICIVLLAIAKAHVQNPRGNYLKSVLYYALSAVPVSGGSYVVGHLVDQLLEKYGWSDGSETPVGQHMMLSLMGRKAGSFGYSSSY